MSGKDDPIDFTQIPVRTEITVLGPDDPEVVKRVMAGLPDIDVEVCTSPDNVRKLDPAIKWVVKEYDGCEISKAPPGLTAEEVIALEKLPEGFEFEPVTGEDDLQPGDVVLSPGLVGGYHVGTVNESRESFTSPNKTFMGFLRFGGDDRNCWVCWGGGNLAAIQKLELQR